MYLKSHLFRDFGSLPVSIQINIYTEEIPDNNTPFLSEYMFKFEKFINKENICLNNFDNKKNVNNTQTNKAIIVALNLVIKNKVLIILCV